MKYLTTFERMKMDKEQMKIPFEPDIQQCEMMLIALSGDNAVIASKGTDRYKIWENIEDAGFATKIYSENACDTYQFSVNRNGINFISKQEVDYHGK